MESPPSPDIKEISKLVTLPNDQRLFTTISQPNTTTAETPTTIIIPGVGCSITEWVVVHRLLKSKTPMLLYERPGIGTSDESLEPRTAKTMARELDTLLSTLSIPPPYILVCHSYGGIIAREYVELRHLSGGINDIIGIVFVDANQEESIQLWPDSNLDILQKNQDFASVIGLTENNALSTEEWEEFLNSRKGEKYARTAGREMENYISSVRALGELKQFERLPRLLKNCPISVIRAYPEIDLWKSFRAGVEAGNGTMEQRRAFEEKLGSYRIVHERIQRGILRLSGKSKFVDLKGCGHLVPMIRPDVIVEEVEWVLRNL
ncbi:hypothetical protein N7478_011901 [Penicillium angulare]|uniref:uncharacterized protein n=1 Tax=Penicillium angulare TaxID=116970 RepID=UPI00253FDF03|nr:uncharacterized protein N7478_011901 [Penicillium angulare]KAJ5261306.1 hypothetical protein N7478_011901 [Penicillium angulare]